MDTEAVETQKPRQKPRVYYGWWIVFVSFLSEVTGGISVYAFPVFYKPMAEAMGWSRTTVALAPTLRTFVSAFISPLIGRLIDHRGPRVIMVIGAILLGGSFVAMAAIGELWHYMLVYSVIGGVALVTRGNLVTLVTVAKWFVRKRGRATAFVTLGVSLSGVIFTPLGAYLVNVYGWRASWVILGVITWIVLVIPAAIFMRRQPEDMGLLPDGEDPANSTTKDAPEGGRSGGDQEETWTLHQAIRAPTFWLIILTFNLGNMSLTGILLHQFNYITDKGFSEAIAATVITVYAFNAIVAKLIYGFVSERVHIRYLVIICFIGAAIGVAILNAATTIQALFAYTVVYGFTRGSFLTIMPLTYANYFGRRFLGTIRGFSTPFNLFASAGGPLFAAWIFDTKGSYSLAFTVFSVTFLLGAFFMFLAKPRRLPKG